MNPRRTSRQLLSLFLLILFAAPAVGETVARVTRVFDGDTLVVAGIGTVRLLGIDCPETEASERDHYYLRRGLTPEVLRQTAQEASAFTRRQTLGLQVTLSFDRERTDRHGRTLAYITLPNGLMLNRLLLENGLAAVYRRFDFRFKEDFLGMEKAARQAGRGIWNRNRAALATDQLTKGGVAILSSTGAQ